MEDIVGIPFFLSPFGFIQRRLACVTQLTSGTSRVTWLESNSCGKERTGKSMNRKIECGELPTTCTESCGVTSQTIFCRSPCGVLRSQRRIYYFLSCDQRTVARFSSEPSNSSCGFRKDIAHLSSRLQRAKIQTAMTRPSWAPSRTQEKN